MNTITTNNPYVEQARRVLSWRPFFRELPPDQQEGYVQAIARKIALYGSPIGKAAVRVDAALDELIDAARDFLELAPAEADAERLGAEALAAAGLSDSPDPFAHGYNAALFREVPEELLGWLFTLTLMSERIEPCYPPDLAEAPKERSAAA